MVITTPRLFVRHLQGVDYEAFLALESDPTVKQLTGPVSTIARDRYMQFISAPSSACMAVCRKDTSQIIGRCGFRPHDDRVELEIFLLPDTQEQRFGSELLEAMIPYCSGAFPELKVAASVSPANSRAIRLLTAHGFADSGDSVVTKFGLEHSVYVRTI
jgi:RimJ/RimL family protein N-acetyltransferase